MPGTSLATEGQPCSRVRSTGSAVLPIPPSGDQHVLDGHWKMEGTRRDPNASPRRPEPGDPHGGIWQVVITNGVGVETNSTTDESCSFTLQISGPAVSADMDRSTSDDCFGVVTGTYRLTDHGTMLTFDWQQDSLGPQWLNTEKSFYRNGLTYIEPPTPGHALAVGNPGG